MKNTSFFKHIGLGLLLASGFSTMAQKTIVTDTKTDQTYANTTQVFKSEKATDSQVLAEIDGNFGIGDVVRIAVAPPPTKTVPPPPPAAPKQTVSSKNPTISVVATSIQQGTTTVNTPSNAAPNMVKAAEPQRVTTPTQQKRTVVYIPLETKPNVAKTAEPQRVATPTNTTPNMVKTVEPQVVTTTPINESNLVNDNTERASTQNNEKQIERRSTKSERTSNSAKTRSSGKSSRKSSFSLFSNLSFKSSKSSKFKSGSKFGCYRF
jgi:hypothetical protein